jgi:hypothetical protein
VSAINFSAVPFQGDADADVNTLMQQKDSQIRMQISQLENFQDMLSDQQRANVLLKEQRNKLKDVVDALALVALRKMKGPLQADSATDEVAADNLGATEVHGVHLVYRGR